MVEDIRWRKEHMRMLLDTYENEATREYCEDSNPVYGWWKEETEEAETHISSNSLLERFQRYDGSVHINISGKAFTKPLREIGVNVKKGIRCADKGTPTTGVERRCLKHVVEDIGI